MTPYNIQHRVIAVWGSPGSGKTTLAVNLAAILAEEGNLVCLVSSNDHGELQTFFGQAIPKEKGIKAALDGRHNVRDSLVEVRHNLFLLEPAIGTEAHDTSASTMSQAQNVFSGLRDQFTYVILDCVAHAGVSAFIGQGLSDADHILVCVPHRCSAATWHIANHLMFSEDALGPKCVYLDSDVRMGGCNMEQLLTGARVEACSHKIPYVEDAFRYENTCKVMALQSGKAEGLYKKALVDVINGLLDAGDGGEQPVAESEPAELKKAHRGFFHK